MSMTACKACGKPVAKSAESCPHCGAFRGKRTSPVTWLVTFLIGFPLLLAIVSGLVFSTP
jgi:hypothetical protein